MTNDISSALAELTPEQRRLLSIRLREARSQRRQPPPAPPRTASDQLPLSFTQEQLWFLDRWDPGTPVYNVPFALRLRGPLDPESLRSALNGVVTRHDALRVVFTEADGSPRQVVRARVDVPLPLVDLRPLPAAERMGAMEREAAAHGRISFDLTS